MKIMCVRLKMCYLFVCLCDVMYFPYVYAIKNALQ